ncbi:hypothetical protein GQ55_5G342000 [Panicum hallii var. hallii]|uniref:AAA+ ATPase domain-containing protein n=1 Tax=Panicum hallii var. hallii TaxID=1504633 RepID=A0A2T7DM43_9POAL|nr:hypothetical protein GQ55_5G342000 [Panicum hallii var. hallii]
MDIVVGALSGMVDALPGKLGELLEQEYALLSGVRGDVVFLQAELGSMRAAIHHCVSLDHPDTQTRAWIGRVRELAHDIEDWVDLFAIRVDAGAGASSSGFFGFFRRGMDKLRTLPARHDIANELQDLKKRIVELSEQRNRYSCVLPVPEAALPMDPRLTALFIDPGSLVGLEGPVEELSKIVMDTDGRTDLKIVSIVGMAGAGKTTLANAFYRRLEVQNGFHCRAFVSVGQKPDLVRILTDIFSQLGDRHRGGQDINQVIDSIRNLLKDKRYLIVVDDLWSKEHWGTIRCCFPENNHGSRIITTTRNDTLPMDSYPVSRKIVHKIDCLSDADAKKLFLKKAFANEHPCPQHLEAVFAQIMRRCSGLPLAVVNIASKLAHKQLRDEWEKIGLNSLCSPHSDGSDGLKQILNLSYHDLSPHLRTCLLYLSIFPENFEVDMERLVRRWIAEGFIAETRSVSTEETARNYLNELISRNLVEPLHLNHDGVPSSCRVHPLIHNFIVCKSIEENFATLMDAQQQHVPDSSTVRRLSLRDSSKQDQPAVRNESTDLSHARSITVFGHANAAPQLTHLKVLRVLDLEGCHGPVCLDGLCKLVLLRYLSLRGSDTSELPATIGDLRCLETLDVSSTKVKELPPSIVRLEKLMYLLAGSAKVPDGIANMKALQTLSCGGSTKSSVNFIEEISKHDNLRELELYSDATETPGNKKRVRFPAHGLRNVKKLCIRCPSPLVIFEPNALPTVQVLELRFQKGLADGSSGMSGMENLSNLKHLLLEFEQNDAGAMATVNAVRNAPQGVLPDHQSITIKVDRKSY